jgi:pyrroline-5-carboxylate reductase
MKIYIIGPGVMGSAIAGRLAASKKYKVVLIGRHDKKRPRLNQADVLVIAVKPQDVPAVAKTIRGQISTKTIIVSIAAGLAISRLSALFGHDQVVRVMPNLGLTVGQGVAGWVAGRSVTRANRAAVKRLLADLTESIEFTTETMLDKVTTISGCGPAYFFYLAEAMVQTALSFGLREKDVRRLVQKTLATAALVQDEAAYPELIARVASKKGVTEAALKVFAKKQFNSIVDDAMRAALNRTEELSHG